MKNRQSHYRAWNVFCCLLIALGVFLFIYAVVTGYGAGNLLYPPVAA